MLRCCLHEPALNKRNFIINIVIIHININIVWKVGMGPCMMYYYYPNNVFQDVNNEVRMVCTIFISIIV